MNIFDYIFGSLLILLMIFIAMFLAIMIFTKDRCIECGSVDIYEKNGWIRCGTCDRKLYKTL